MLPVEGLATLKIPRLVHCVRYRKFAVRRKELTCETSMYQRSTWPRCFGHEIKFQYMNGI